MNKKYTEILNSLKNDEMPKNANDRILIIDGLNTFIRSFVVVPTVNDNGIHVGGITGFLMSIGYAIRNIKPTRVIICFDGKGGSQKRRKIFPNYKSSRRVKHRMTRINEFNSVDDERIAMAQQLQRLSEYLETLPVTVLYFNLVPLVLILLPVEAPDFKYSLTSVATVLPLTVVILFAFK